MNGLRINVSVPAQLALNKKIAQNVIVKNVIVKNVIARTVSASHNFQTPSLNSNPSGTSPTGPDLFSLDDFKVALTPSAL